MPRAGLYAFAALLAVITGLLAWRLTPGPGPVATGGTSAALIGGPFALTDQAGMPRASGDFRGRYLLIYFGYTTCPDVCPTELTKMAAALTALEKSDAARASLVQPLFITVDPERDTVAAMKDYVPNFHPRLIGLTGSPAQIKSVTQAYRVYVQKSIPRDDPQNYLMDHSSFIYLMGPDGRYVSHFTNASSVAEITSGLKDMVK